ncbi:phosducin-like protein [Cimex lectularius]|uniref:Phosducin domain-containing protein n=1 Tax=Cimex lectularius TaxID=79782 RepID=A0A8I6TE15_CIMLE|nr:phosducin-like protein [Cimex lectularius]
MTTLEDKILGEKKHYYCSSSESGDESDDGSDNEVEARSVEVPSLPEVNKWDGVSSNTGPKGVIRDWQRFKQLETEKRQEDELERLNLAKTLCLDGDKRDEDMDLADDQFMVEFRKKRMTEIAEVINRREPNFGVVTTLANGSEFLDAIDNEDKSVTIVVHLYEENVPTCKIMNRCLDSLAHQYTKVKFCKMVGSTAGISHRFQIDGVPALLAYKEGQIIGNFVRVVDELGDEFYDGDVENFLIEHGILLDRHCVPNYIQNNQDADEDSDWSLE